MYIIGPNVYVLPSLLGRTVEAGKKQNPMWTQTARSKAGGFDQDLGKVSNTRN